MFGALLCKSRRIKTIKNYFKVQSYNISKTNN